MGLITKEVETQPAPGETVEFLKLGDTITQGIEEEKVEVEEEEVENLEEEKKVEIGKIFPFTKENLPEYPDL